jgi:F0F1-type ATP synthase membrane subunit b/b'
MADILRQFVTMATTATIVAPIMKMMNAMSTIQTSPIERAATQHNWLFAVYFVLLLVIALMTWIVWKSGNRVQDEVRKDADARIAIADSRAAEARAESDKANAGLAKSNEEIARLTAESEKAKAERAEADKQIAIAKADAARAKEGTANAQTEVARLQSTVANAERKRLDAERALTEVQTQLEKAKAETARIKAQAFFAGQDAAHEEFLRTLLEQDLVPRTLNAERMDVFRKNLQVFAGTRVVFISLPDTEPTRTAEMLRMLLWTSGWRAADKVETRTDPTGWQIPDGIRIEINSASDKHLVAAVEAIREVLFDSGVAGGGPVPASTPLPEGTIRIIVGLRPTGNAQTKKMREDADRALMLRERDERKERKLKP